MTFEVNKKTVLTAQQTAAARAAISGDALVMSDAGTGKTTLIKEAAVIFLKETQGKGSIVYLSFGEAMNKSAEKMFLGIKVTCKTFHAFALDAIKNENKKITLSKSSDYEKMRMEQLRCDNDFQLKQLVAMCKVYGVNTAEGIRYITDTHFSHFKNINSVEQNCERYFKAFMKKPDWANVAKISFDDLIYHAGKGHITLPKYHLTIVDECQDANAMQWDIAYRTTYNGNARCGRVFAVGDIKQSIFGFQGADHNVMTKKTKQMRVFPLTLSFRCPTEVVAHIKSELKMAFEMQALPEHEGAIIKTESYTNIKKERSMVLCRTNAPLFKLYCYLYNKGYKVRLNASSNAFWQLTAEVKKCHNIAALARSINFMRNDTGDILGSLMEGCASIADLQQKIALLQKGHAGSDAVLLSTVHSAKGLEANHVYILAPEKLGEHRGRNDFERVQELNLHYVAFSRCKWSAEGCGLYEIWDFLC